MTNFFVWANPLGDGIGVSTRSFELARLILWSHTVLDGLVKRQVG